MSMLIPAHLLNQPKSTVSLQLISSENELLHLVADQQKRTFSDFVNELLHSALQTYFTKQEYLNHARFCQSCGIAIKSKKKIHVVQVCDEMFIFGPCCFDNEKYKEIVKQFI